MFDMLSGTKVNLTITTERPAGTPYYPGDTVSGTLTIDTNKELKVQEGRIALICKEEYEYRREESSTDSDGDTSTGIVKSWSSEEYVAGKTVFVNQGVVAKGKANQRYSFVIPNDAVSTGIGDIVKVKWLVKATLDRKMASDYNAELVIPVYTIVPSAASVAGEFGQSNELGEANISLHLPGRMWAMGETIEGKLLVNPQKNFDASEIRVVLTESENVPCDEGNTAKKETIVKLAGGTNLQAGQAQTFPFRLTLPAGRPTTMRTNRSQVTWTLSGVLARRLRSDTKADVELTLYSKRQK